MERVILKLSGQALSDTGTGISAKKIEAVVKEIKELEETRSFYKPLDDKYEDISIQIAELNQYLPKMLTDEEVECLVVGCIPECQSPVTKGKLVGMVAKKVGNRFDKSRIKEIVDRVVE